MSVYNIKYMYLWVSEYMYVHFTVLSILSIAFFDEKKKQEVLSYLCVSVFVCVHHYYKIA